MAYMSADHAAEIREAIKKEFPFIKFSITRSHHSGICIAIMESHIDFMQIDRERKHINVNTHYIEDHYKEFPEVVKILTRLHEIADKGNHNKSDIMTDYFDVGWYIDIEIGKWDKPFKLVPEKQIKKPVQRATAPAGELPAKDSLQVVEYSDKAIAIFGDTFPVKDTLKELGGRYNAFLKKDGKQQAGWIFSKTKEAEVKRQLQLV